MELLQTLLKMAPTTEEELKLRLFSGDLSQLGPAERFLKVLVDFPLAFKRIESLLFMSSVREEVSTVKESLKTLEVRQRYKLCLPSTNFKQKKAARFLYLENNVSFSNAGCQQKTKKQQAISKTLRSSS